jgi:hypothetical protein
VLMAQRPVGGWVGAVVYSEATKVKYTITGRLGEGGYAHVFRCTDFFGQSFVMKILKTCSPHHTTRHTRNRTTAHARNPPSQRGWTGGDHYPRAW